MKCDSKYAIIRLEVIIFNIVFYENEKGFSDVWEWLETLRQKAATNKDARIQHKQAVTYIQLLSDNGTILPETIVKHLSEGIWELRPGSNRILFFFQKDETTYVLLHHFRKRSQKTPTREIKKARSEMLDYLSRKEN